MVLLPVVLGMALALLAHVLLHCRVYEQLFGD